MGTSTSESRPTGNAYPCRRLYRRRTRDRINARHRAYVPLWRARNPDKVRAARRRQMAKPEYRLVQRMRERAWQVLKKVAVLKRTSHSKLFGAPVKEVKAYLEAKFKEGMSWANWGFGPDKWHLDHIIPLSAFDLSIPGEMERAFHYTNLQPLWQPENLAKGNRLPD
jgi:5-methylcytosine-specific restriction endonuclease McrA